jgi:peptidoglycan/xylan/chitin deacetylase (PgdA/CDA1 family)
MVTETEFRQQMNELRHLFNPVGLDDVRNWLRGADDLPHRPVLVTFDDGFANTLSYAVPILRETGIPAVFFLPTGYIGDRRVLWPTELYLRVCTWKHNRLPLPMGGEISLNGNSQHRTAMATAIEETCKRLPMEQWTRYLCQLRDGSTPSTVVEQFGDFGEEMFSFLNWDEVREIHRLGFDIGSHSVEHPILSRVGKERLREDLRVSKQTIESEVGCECYSFAYPNGGRRDFDEEAPAAILEAGYQIAFTLMGRMCHRDASPVLLDRVWIPGGDGLASFRTRTSGMFLQLKRFAGEV